MNIKLQPMVMNGLLGQNSLLWGGGLKSTQEMAQRQTERDAQIAFFEQKKEELKGMECETVEEISKKLKQFHSYEDKITAVKASFNREQMEHVLDEAKEQGEKMAEELEKSEPKTPEERREEAIKEALGIEDNEGMLDEMLEEMEETVGSTQDLEESLEALEELEEMKAAQEALEDAKDARKALDGMEALEEVEVMDRVEALEVTESLDGAEALEVTEALEAEAIASAETETETTAKAATSAVARALAKNPGDAREGLEKEEIALLLAASEERELAYKRMDLYV